MAESVTKTDRVRRKRLWPKVVLGLVVLLVAVVALLPMIAGAVAPGYVESSINASINGKAKVQGLSLGYFSGQRVGPVVVTDEAGKKVGELSVAVKRGLLGLAGVAFGKADLGTIDVSGSVALDIAPDGTTTIDRLLKKSAGAPAPGAGTATGPASKGEARVVPNLKGVLNIDELEVTVNDQRPGRGTAAVRHLKGGGTFSTRDSINIQLAALPEIVQPGKPASAGTFKMSATISSLFNEKGQATPENAKVDVKIDGESLPTALVDAFAPDLGAMALMGEKLGIKVDASGSMRDLKATLRMDSLGVNADAELAYSDTEAGRWVSIAKPVTLWVDGQRALSMPMVAKALAGQDQLAISQAPEVKIAIESMKVRLPGEGQDARAVDMRGSGVRMTISSGATKGTVRVPGPDGKPGAAQAFEIAPIKGSLEAADLSKAASFVLGTTATLDGKPAGEIAANVKIDGLLDEKGAIRTMPGSVDGTVALRQLATAIAQPFVQSAGLDLNRDVGPTLDVEIATTQQDTPSLPADANPADFAYRIINLRIDSRNVKGTGRVGLFDKGNQIRTLKDEPWKGQARPNAPDSSVQRTEALELRIEQLGPTLNGLLAASGVTNATGLPVTVSVRDVGIDLLSLKTKSSDPKALSPDLRGITGIVEVKTGQGGLSVPLYPGKPASNVGVMPSTTVIDLTKLRGGDLSVALNAAATLDGQPAGTIAASIAGTKLLNKDGALVLDQPQRLAAKVSVDNVRTALAQPFLADAGLDLPADIGPTVNVQLSATNLVPVEKAAIAAAAGAELRVSSERLSVIASLDFDGSTLRTAGGTGGAVDIQYQKPGALFGRFLKSDSGVRVSPDGWLKVAVRDLVVPVEKVKGEKGETLAPAIAKAQAGAEFSIGGFEMQPILANGQANGEALKIASVQASASLVPGKTPTLGMKGSMSQGALVSTIDGGFELPGLVTNGALTPKMARPVGQLTIKDLPTLLAKLVPPGEGTPAKDGQPAKAPMDLAGVVQGAMGPAFTVKLKSDKVGSATPTSPGGVKATFNLESQRLNGYLVASIDEPALNFEGGAFNVKSNPDAFGLLMKSLTPGQAPTLTLFSPMSVGLKIEPVKLPMLGGGGGAGFSPDWSKAGVLKARMLTESPVLIDGLVMVEDEQKNKKPTGPAGVDTGSTIDFAVPLSALKGGAEAIKVDMELKLLQGGPGGKLGLLKINADAPMESKGGVEGGEAPLSAKIAFTEVDTARIDAVLGQPGLVSQALGKTMTLTGDARVRLPSKEGEQPRAEATIAFDSELAKTNRPMQLVMDAERMALKDPAVIDWTMRKEWAERTLLGVKPGTKPEDIPVRFAGPTAVKVTIPKAALGAGEAMFKPGVFGLDAIVQMPRIDLVSGSTPAAPLRDFQLRVMNADKPGQIGFSVQAQHEGGTPDKPALKVGGNVVNLSDAAGKLTSDAARLNATGEANNFPLGLVDALAKQKGLLVEALGPTGQMKFGVQELWEKGGVIALQASSARASANLKGRIENGAFVNENPAVFTLAEISPGLGKKLVPKLGTFEKKLEDGPAKITISSLRAPIDGDLAKLNGDVVFELGTARFQTDDIFGTILKAVGGKQAGKLGQRIEPFKAKIVNGVVNYERFRLPIGEFTLDTRGSINLVNDSLDIITYFPVDTLSDDAAKFFKQGLGQLGGGGAAPMLPFRLRGPSAKPKLEPDVGLFAEEALSGLKEDPGKLLEGLLKKKEKK